LRKIDLSNVSPATRRTARDSRQTYQRSPVDPKSPIGQAKLQELVAELARLVNASSACSPVTITIFPAGNAKRLGLQASGPGRFILKSNLLSSQTNA
jgi:hypothetical protein